MDTIHEILQLHGYDTPQDMDTGDHVTVTHEEDGMMPLTIEKIGDNRLSVAHYYTQRGDLMSDPEIVFTITDDEEWIPVRYTQHPHIHQHNEAGLPDVATFAKQWDQTLKTQGYIDEAQPHEVDA